MTLAPPWPVPLDATPMPRLRRSDYFYTNREERAVPSTRGSRHLAIECHRSAISEASFAEPWHIAGVGGGSKRWSRGTSRVRPAVRFFSFRAEVQGLTPPGYPMPSLRDFGGVIRGAVAHRRCRRRSETALPWAGMWLPLRGVGQCELRNQLAKSALGCSTECSE
jgi:hypothetical protein